QATILALNNIVSRQWGEEGWPAAVGGELLRGAEKLSVAGTAAVNAFGCSVGVFTDMRAFCACLAQNLILLGIKALAPLLVRESPEVDFFFGRGRWCREIVGHGLSLRRIFCL